MAFTAATIWEVQSATGNDGNGGCFDTSPTFLTLGNVAAGDTATPTITVAWTTLASDVGHWIFLRAGTNVRPGWYKILSRTGSIYTIDAAIGNWVQYDPTDATLSLIPGAALGCLSSGTTSTSVLGAIDYSQSTTPLTFTDLVITSSASRLSSATRNANVSPYMVGNSLNITAGTNFTVQRVYISSVNVAGNYYQCDKNVGTLGATGGTGTLGGPLATTGTLGISGLLIAGMDIAVSGTITSTTTTANVVGGSVSTTTGSPTSPIRWFGYTAVRGDRGKATLRCHANGMTLFAGVSSHFFENIIFDANGFTTCQGVHSSAATHSGGVIDSVFSGLSIAYSASHASYSMVAVNCRFSNCGTAMTHSNSGSITATNTQFSDCTTAYSSSSSAAINVADCIFDTCTSGMSISPANTSARIDNCTFYNCSSLGIQTASSTSSGLTISNSLFVGNLTGISVFTGSPMGFVVDCAFYNNTTDIAAAGRVRVIGKITLTADPFVDAPNQNFALNNTSGAGLACRGASKNGYSGSIAYEDIGAVQSRTGAENFFAGFLG